MLKEVSQTALRLLLIDGAHTLSDVEVGHMLRIVIVADVIGKSIVEFTDTYGRIDGDWWHLHFLCHSGCRTEHCQHSCEKHSNFHTSYN